MDKINYEKIFEGAKTLLIKFSDVLISVHNWYERNAKNIEKYLLVFSGFSTFCAAIDTLAEKQIIFTDDLTLEFANEICDSDEIDALVGRYYFDNNKQKMKILIERCRSAKEIASYKELFSQIIDAYYREHYYLACVGMFSLIDGVLADTSQMIDATSFNKRISAIEKKISDKVDLNDFDRKTLCIYTSMEKIKETMFGNSDFKETEPSYLNRHWIIHGRTRKSYSEYDFLKTVLCLDAISYMTQLTYK